MLAELFEAIAKRSSTGKIFQIVDGHGQRINFAVDGCGNAVELHRGHDNPQVDEEVIDLRSLIDRVKLLLQFPRFEADEAAAFFGYQSVVVVMDAAPVEPTHAECEHGLRSNIVRLKLEQSRSMKELVRLTSSESWTHRELCSSLRSYGLYAAELEGIESISVTNLKNNFAGEDGLSKSVRKNVRVSETEIPDTATFRVPIYTNAGFDENLNITYGFSFEPSHDAFSIHLRDDFRKEQQALLTRISKVFTEATGVSSVLGSIPNPSLIGE